MTLARLDGSLAYCHSLTICSPRLKQSAEAYQYKSCAFRPAIITHSSYSVQGYVSLTSSHLRKHAIPPLRPDSEGQMQHNYSHSYL